MKKEDGRERATSEKFHVTANKIKALLAEKYTDVRQFASAAEVGCCTGWANRRIDFMVLHCWESEGYEIEAFEIKISKSDLRRELMDPSKHNVFFDDIDRYWIVAPDFVLDDLSVIPKNWGVMKVLSDKDGISLKAVRKPLALHDESASKRPISRTFAASLCRAINAQSAYKCKLYEEQKNLHESIKREIEEKITGGAHVISDYEFKTLKNCESICRGLGVDAWYEGMSERRREEFRRIRRIAEDIERLDGNLANVERTTRFLRSLIKNGIIGEGDKVSEKAVDDSRKEMEDGDKTSLSD